MKLPFEVLIRVASYLPREDRVSFGLTCSVLYSAVSCGACLLLGCPCNSTAECSWNEERRELQAQADFYGERDVSPDSRVSFMSRVDIIPGGRPSSVAGSDTDRDAVLSYLDPESGTDSQLLHLELTLTLRESLQAHE